MHIKFVDRNHEMITLQALLNRVRAGDGKTTLMEGAAGIGKTALIDRFLNEAKNVEILRGKCNINSKYRPYSLFTNALTDYGDLQSIREIEEKRKIEDLSHDLMVRPRMLFVDEVGNGAGILIYQTLRKKMEGIYLSNKMPESSDGVWLTETKTEKRQANPNHLDFNVVPIIYDFMRVKNTRVIYIDNINYLIYLNSIDRVVEFLHTIYSLSESHHIIIISGKPEHLAEDEKNKLLACFDEIISLDINKEQGHENMYMVDSPEDVNSAHPIVFSSRTGVGKYTIGREPMTPQRIDFEIFETVSMEIENGRDVVLDCLAYLIHYHGIRKIYLWVKAIADLACKNGVHVYIVTKGLSARYIDMLGDLSNETPALRHMNSEALQESGAMKFYDAIFNFLDYNSKKHVIILVLEDIQWADKSSLELLRYLTRNIMKSRIMIIITYRNEDIVSDEENASIIEDIQKLENTVIIRLNNLSKTQVTELAKNIKGEITDSDINIIYEKSEGNPLLVITILEQLENKNFVIPESIKESVELMLDSLDDRSLYFLRLLSVMGDTAPLKIVEQIYPNWKDAFEKVKGKFIKLRDKAFVFTYAPYSEIIYADISKDTKMKMHQRIAEEMEKSGNIVDAANHYYLSKNLQALNLLERAAEESINNLAFGDAIDYYKMALEIAKKYERKEDIIRIYELLGDRYVMSGKYKNSIDMYNQSLISGNTRKVAVGIKIGDAYQHLGQYTKALEIFTSFEKDAHGMERGKIYGAIGIIKWHIGDFEDSQKFLEKYLKYAKRYHRIEDEAEAYRNIAIIYYYRANYTEGLKFAIKALEKANKSGRYDLIANAYNVVGVIYERRGEYDDALQYFKKYLEISEKIGNYDYIAKAYNNLAIVYDFLGDIEKEENYYLLSLEMNFKIGNKRDMAISYNNLAVMESEFGDAHKAIDYLQMSLKNAGEINDTYNICTTYMNLGSFYLQLMEYESAIDALKKGIKIAENENYHSTVVSIATILSSVYIEMNDLKNAVNSIKIAEKFVDPDDKNSKLTVMASWIEYYMKLNDINRAEDILEEAIEIADEMKDEDFIHYFIKYRAQLRCMRKDYNYAVIYFEKYIEYQQKKKKKKDLAEAYRKYAECLSKYNKNDAKKYYNHSYTLYKELNNMRRAKEITKRIKEL